MYSAQLERWVYAMVNALASKKCQAAIAWEPEISKAITELKNLRS